MTRRERIKKSDAKRTEPIRNWQTVFRDGKTAREAGVAGMNQQDNSDGSQSFAERVASIPNEAINAWSAATRAAGDIAEQSVRQGYSVVEEQIKRGRDTARQSSNGHSNGQASGGDSTTNGSSANQPYDPLGIADLYSNAFGNMGAGGSADMSQLISRMAKTTVDLSTLCLQFSNSVISNPQAISAMGEFWKNAGFPVNPGASDSSASAGQANEPANQASAENTTSPSAVAGLGIEVNSSGSTNASVRLFSGVSGSHLITHGLHSDDTAAPPLKNVSFSAGTLTIDVPDEQPSGLYRGVLIDAGGDVGGTVSVEITANPGGSKPKVSKPKVSKPKVSK